MLPTRGNIPNITFTVHRRAFLQLHVFMCISDAMKWLSWTPYHHVLWTAGSCFIQRLFSCFCPTSLAFVCTFSVQLMRMMVKKNRENQLQALTKDHQTLEKVCSYLFKISLTYYTLYYNIFIILEVSTPLCSGEVRRWSHGGYTLLHDGEASQAEYALDLVLPFGCAGLCTTLSYFHIFINTFLVQV